MSLDTLFVTGSLAKGYREVAEWYGRHAEDMDAKHIFNPFFGFGRIASAMCEQGTVTDSCDFQRLSTLISWGVFREQEYHTTITEPKFLKGPTVAGEFLKGDKYAPDLRSAGFIDYVVKYGSALDAACVGMAIPSQTLRGWLTQWTGSFETFWDKFCSLREDCRPQVGMPGRWRHWEADLFGLLDDGVLRRHYDVIALDPPRLCPTTDLYSSGWKHINHVLGGQIAIQPWTPRNYVHRLDRILRVSSGHLLFTWTEGDGPPYRSQIFDWLRMQGQIEDEIRWQTHGKTIHGWRVRRIV